MNKVDTTNLILIDKFQFYSKLNGLNKWCLYKIDENWYRITVNGRLYKDLDPWAAKEIFYKLKEALMPKINT
jgi:hypothetical protein